MGLGPMLRSQILSITCRFRPFCFYPPPGGERDPAEFRESAVSLTRGILHGPRPHAAVSKFIDNLQTPPLRIFVFPPPPGASGTRQNFARAPSL